MELTNNSINVTWRDGDRLPRSTRGRYSDSLRQQPPPRREKVQVTIWRAASVQLIVDWQVYTLLIRQPARWLLVSPAAVTVSRCCYCCCCWHRRRWTNDHASTGIAATASDVDEQLSGSRNYQIHYVPTRASPWWKRRSKLRDSEWNRQKYSC